MSRERVMLAAMESTACQQAVMRDAARPGRATRVCVLSPLGYGLYRPERGLPFGGAEVQLHLLATSLAEDPAFDVTVLTTIDDAQPEVRLGRLRLRTRQGKGRLGVPATSVLRRVGGYACAFREMFATLRRIDADVYVHAGGGPEVGAYALICRILRRRLIFVVASTADIGGEGAPTDGPLPWLSPLGIRLADTVICRTAEQQTAVRSRYGRDAVVIPTAHPVPPVTDEAPERSAVLWVGRAHPLKQPEVFLDLAARLPAHRHVMVAMRDAAHADLFTRIRARARHLANLDGFADRPWTEMSAVFARAAVLVNTSTYEGFPNTFVQAWMHGAPVVSWRVDPGGVLERERIGVCAHGSFDRLVEAVDRLMGDRNERMRLGRAARDYARAHHALDRCLPQWKTVLTRPEERPG